MSLLDTASLIVTPNGYKEGKLFSVIPSDGSGDMSVVRATDATRKNSAGLVELVPYNLLTYSEDFSNAAWISGEVSLLSGQSSPNGTNTAFKITGTSAVNAFLLQGGISVSSGNTYTASVYLKGDTSGSVSLRVDSGSTAPNNPVSYTTEWQRFTYTFTAGSTTATAILGGYTSWTGSEAIYVYGFQLVEGSTAKDYQKTETRLNIPRLDYSNGTCPSLLVEPQRTNLALWSSSFDNAAWSKSNVTITANDTISPSGIQDADLCSFTSSSNSLILSASNSATSTYTISVFAKKGTGNILRIREVFYFGTSSVFNLDIGAVVSGSGKIEDYGNGWYRCSITQSYSSGETAIQWSFDSNTNVNNFYLWGAQLEAGSYPTSYIPTTSASVTRNADVISKTGISSLIGQTEGTIFWEGKVDGRNTAYNEAIPISLFASGANVSGAQIYLNFPSNGQIIYVVFDGTAVQAIISTSSSFYTLGTYIKIAVAYKANDFVLYINGTQIGTDTSGSVPALADMYFDYQNQAGKYSINAAALWKTRLTNTQLATLTTL
jgi:hypothetical protein